MESNKYRQFSQSHYKAPVQGLFCIMRILAHLTATGLTSLQTLSG